MTGLEVATSAALGGRAPEWRAQLQPRVDDLREAWAAHVSGTEGPGGLWEQIRTDAPRLDGNLRRLRREHEALAAEVEALSKELSNAGDDEARLTRVRERVTALLIELVRHRQRGADLIYEAYERDVGGHG
jgi:seryl-tRNA synthetase